MPLNRTEIVNRSSSNSVFIYSSILRRETIPIAFIFLLFHNTGAMIPVTLKSPKNPWTEQKFILSFLSNFSTSR